MPVADRARRAALAVAVAVAAAGTAVAGATAAAPPPSTHDPERVRRLADEILARPEFAPPARGPLQRILDWVRSLFEGSQPSGSSEGSGGGSVAVGAGAGSGGSAVLTVVLLVAAAVLLGFVVHALRGRLGWRRRRDEDDVEIDVERRLTVDEWEAAARRHEAEGRWKDGLRCRFRGLVERLVARGAVPDVPGRTAGELRVDLRESAPEVADDFAVTAELFERAWYGDLPTGPDEAGRFEEHARRVLSGTGQER